MADPLRILSIGAHPADVFDQSGGTMAHHTSRGDYVACVVLTHGARIHDAVISDSMYHLKEVPDGTTLSTLIAERSDVKANEVRAACEILGVEDIYFFGADDAVLLVKEETVKQLARLLRQVRPDIILTHSPGEGNGIIESHAIAGQITLHAVQFAGSVDTGDRNPPHRVGQVFFFGGNEVFIDITDVVDKKLAVLDCLVSQGYAGDYARKRLETDDGNRGGCAYAEGYVRMRAETHTYLPLTDAARARIKASDHEIMARYSYRLPVD